MRKYLLLLIISIISLTGFSQDFSNKGKDFWVGYGYHQVMGPNGTGGNGQNMVLYFATEAITSVTVSIPGIGYTQTFANIAANTIFTTPIIPKNAPQDARLFAEGVSDKGIHIVSDKPIVAYAHIYNASVSGACLLLPTKTLGKEYYSINYTNNSNSADASSWFYVIATDPGTTTVEIRPTANTIGGWLAGQTYTVNLTQGQVYNVKGVLTSSPNNCNPVCTGVDLTGSSIKSVASANGECKKIAVYSGSGRISITCNGNGSSSDNYMVQAFPKSAWGKKYLTVPPGGNMTNCIYRVCVQDPATIVQINGAVTVLPLVNGFYYEIPVTATPQKIEADKPIMVAQYFTSQGACGNGNPGDPEVIYLSPVEQNIDKVIFNSNLLVANQPPVHNHLVNVMIPNSGTAISSFRIDGNIPAGAFTVHPQDPAYAYIKIAGLTQTQHIIQSDSGFNATAYGFGGAESYGYNAGTNVKDLYQQIGVSTEYGIEQTPSVCSGSPFRFKVSLPYCADSIKWDLSNLPGPPPTPPTILYTTCTPGPGGPDSTTVVNGKTIYWYSLPSIYSFGVVGTYPVTITTFFPNGECGNSQDIDFDLQVSAPPIADFAWIAPGCPAEPVFFIDNTTTVKPTYRWWWDFGDGNFSTLKSPSHIYATAGTYTVRYTNITTPGCLSDTISHQIIVPPLATATISGTMEVCENGTMPNITFTAADGKAPYEFTYNINGGANQTVITTVGNTITVGAPTNVPGTFTYNLVSVKNVGSTVCTQNQTGSAVIKVNPLPTAAVAGNITVCLNDAAPNVIFTGATGTTPYTFTYNINGGANQTVTTTVGNSATVAAPATIAGTYIYNLISVKDGTSTACTQNQTGNVTVIVKDLPTASVAGTVNVCLNATSPNITFTGAVGVAPYEFTYNINGGVNQTVTTTVGNSVTVAVPTTTVGTFIYNLVSVKEGSANACTQLQTGSATVVVNPLPTASVTGAITVCLNATFPNITFTGAGSTAPYTFTYNINGGASQTVTTAVGNAVTVAAPTTIAGTFMYNLISVQDGSSTACSQLQGGSSIVTVNQLPTASVSGTNAACLNGPSPSITFTGAVGTAPYTFTYNINGGANQTVTTIVGNSVTVLVPTTTVGTFTYNLVSVTEGSANACNQNQTGSAIVTINPLPTATVSGANAVCLNATSPVITFTGAGSTAPYTFTYNINGGANQTVTTTAGNSATIVAPTNVAGTFTYNLVSVQDGSSTLCSQAQVGNIIIIIHPLPTPNFSFTLPSCDTRVITFTDNSVANVGTLTNWVWNFGDGNTATGTPVTHIYPTAGNYNATLTVTTSNNCSNALPFTKVVTINNRPQAGFIVPEVCINDVAAVFTDTSKIAIGGFDILGYEWNYGDPGSGVLNNSTGINGSHLYTAVGSYTVRHIVTSSLGCKDTIVNNIFINGADPVANFSVTNAGTLCANDSVSIVNISTISAGSITKVDIYWDFVGTPTVVQTDDFPAPNKVYKHKYPNFQTPPTVGYTIRFRAYSGTLCQDVKSTTITVNAAPKVQFNAMAAACLDAAPFLITQASEIGGVPGTFVYSGTGITSAAGMFNPALAGVGTHTIKYTFTSTAAGCVDTISRAITVLDTATAKFSFANPVCEGTAATFTEQSTAPAGVVLNNTIWNFGDGTPLENHVPGTTFTHAFPAWGNYTVTMYNTSAYGCKSTSKVRQVYVSPIPQAVFAPVQASVCLPNAAVSFVNSSSIADGSAITYLWNFGDPASGLLNTSSSVTPPPHIYTGTGPYTVRLTVTSGSNCVKDITRLVDFIHPQPKAAFSFSKPEVCIGDVVVLRDLTNGIDGSVVQWNWNFGDASLGSLPIEPHLYAAPKTYDVSLFIVNSRGCNSDTLTQQFTVHPYPMVDAGPDRVVLQGGSITIQSNVTGNDLQYLWTPATYLNNATIATPTASNMQDDITYTLMVTGRGGCAKPDNMFVKVLKAPRIPNTFTPNGDGINEFWLIDYLDTYPNCRVQVFTRTGQLVFESKGYKTPWNGTLNGKPLPFDTYYYIVEPESGRAPITGYVTIVK